jgi:integrase
MGSERISRSVTVASIKKMRLRKPKDGKVQHTYQVRWRDPAGVRKARAFRSRAQADAFAAKIDGQIRKGDYRDPNVGRRERVGDFYQNRWLPWAELRLSPTTLGLMTDHWRLYVGPAFAKYRFATLTKLDIQTFLQSTARDASPYQAETSLRLLRSILRAAVDDGLLDHSVALDVKAPKRPARKVRYLSADDVSKLVAAHPERWRAFVLVAAYGGLRFGELAGLRLRHVDFLRRKMLVEDAIVEAGGKLHERPTKSGKARTVTLPAFVMDALADHIERWPPERDGLVFADERGGPLWRMRFYKSVWWPAVERAKIGDLRFHDLRHTSAALAIAHGAHPKTIQMRLGHHSAAFTLDVYGGLFESLDEDLAERFDESAPKDAEYEPLDSLEQEAKVIPFTLGHARKPRRADRLDR